MATMSALGAEKPVVIFSKSGCCFGHTIKTLINSFGASPAVYELDELPYGRQLERELSPLRCRPSVPAVFIGGSWLAVLMSCKSRVCNSEVESKEKSLAAVAAKQRWHDDRQWWQNQDRDHGREKRAHNDGVGCGFGRRKKNRKEMGCRLQRQDGDTSGWRGWKGFRMPTGGIVGGESRWRKEK
ncbi:hypothetical protein ACSBR1_021773 [Camellia fascicularis]